MSGEGAESARSAYDALHRWLLEAAYPLWARRGWDSARGSFHERLGADGPVLTDPRRTRVQLRQIYCFARAAALGWHGDTRALVIGGLEHVFAHCQRPDGLLRAVLGPDGEVLDERALLYDQAFALLALASAHRALGAGAGCAARAAALWDQITHRLHAPLGLRADTASCGPLLANPHMHLLEALLAWAQIDAAPHWRQWADAIATLALERLIDPDSGALRERYELDAAGRAIRSGPVEPGHLFEWAGLLLQLDGARPRLRAAALRLVEIAATRGVCAGVAVNALRADLTVLDPEARLWPQTERVKTWAQLARLSGEARYWTCAAAAAATLRSYLATPVPGLWYDRRRANGAFVPEPSPASSFYHIIGAISALAAALEDG
jgi:mannose/cellobiose epimerase-like protein (N-acyl-D-glucosamine 2-epimerase family)